jgi:hypothetical protein
LRDAAARWFVGMARGFGGLASGGPGPPWQLLPYGSKDFSLVGVFMPSRTCRKRSAAEGRRPMAEPVPVAAYDLRRRNGGAGRSCPL